MINKLFDDLRSSDPEKRMFAEEEILKNFTSEDVPAIIELISDEDRNIRNTGINLLSTISDERIPSFLTKFVASEDIAIRNLAGELLIKYSEKSVPPLLDLLSKTQDADEIKFAVDILGYIGNPAPENYLIDILNKATDENVILACIEALGNIKGEKSVAILRRIFGKNPLFDPSIIEALGKIGNTEAYNFIFSHYDDANDLVKFAIVDCLGELGDEEMFFFLLSELNDNSGLISWIMLKSIYKLKEKYCFDIPFDERMKNLVVEAVLEADDEIKDYALSMLADFNDKESVMICLKNYGFTPSIDERLKYKFQANINIVLKSLSEFVKNDCENLLQILMLVNEVICEDSDVIKEISTVEMRVLVSLLTDILKDPSEEMRYYAQELIFRIDPESAFICSDLMMNDISIWNRMRFTELAGESLLEKSHDILTKMKEDPEEMVSEKANYFLSLKAGVWNA